MVRRITPNSHDQFGASRQADKATIQLAANAHEPSIRELMVNLLNNLQPEVDQCHQSHEAQGLMHKVAEMAEQGKNILGADQKMEGGDSAAPGRPQRERRPP